MQSTARTPEEYVENLPAERKPVNQSLREVILKNLPGEFYKVYYGTFGINRQISCSR